MTTHFSGPVDSTNGFHVGGTEIIDENGKLLPDNAIVSASVTATADGTGTGTISDESTFVTVTSGDANHIVVLPTPTPGKTITIAKPGATGFELRSSAPATVSINGGSGASAESAIGATALLIVCRCLSATAWICNSYVAAGTESAVEAAA